MDRVQKLGVRRMLGSWTAATACGIALAAATARAQPTEAAPAPAAKVKFHSVANLAWMAGGWGRTEGDRTTEEHWLPPAGDAMLGMHRDISGGTMTAFEFIRIVAEPSGVFYIASPNGAVPTRFRLVESAPRRVTFANPDHDFPKRISYWLDDDGAMHARVEGEGGESAQEWVWDRLQTKAATR